MSAFVLNMYFGPQGTHTLSTYGERVSVWTPKKNISFEDHPQVMPHITARQPQLYPADILSVRAVCARQHCHLWIRAVVFIVHHVAACVRPDVAF